MIEMDWGKIKDIIKKFNLSIYVCPIPILGKNEEPSGWYMSG